MRESSSSAPGESADTEGDDAARAGVTRRVIPDGGRLAGDADDRQTDRLAATDALVAAYRHDVHKLRGRRHDAAAGEYAGVAVNEQVPRGADQDAALLSRPRGEPEQTVDNRVSPYRLSLLTGESAVTRERIQAATGGGFRALVTPTDAEELHARWLTSDVPSVFNESVYYPYTSAKYHTLLVAALLDNYRAGHGFDDLVLTATAPGEKATAAGTMDASTARIADVVESHRTVLWTPEIALHVTGVPGDRPAARLGAVPARSFADVWARLPDHPLDVDAERHCRMLDAQLRRIRSWSTALAFIEEFVAAFGPGDVTQPQNSSEADSAW